MIYTASVVLLSYIGSPLNKDIKSIIYLHAFLCGRSIIKKINSLVDQIV